MASEESEKAIADSEEEEDKTPARKDIYCIHVNDFSTRN
jgi:hypothetical protein